MKRSIYVLVAVLLMTMASRTLHAQDSPVAVLSFKSADRLLNGVGSVGRWLALTGTAAEQQQGEQRMRSFIEPFLASLDPNLPAGAIVWLSPEGMPDALVFLPIEDASSLLNSIAPFVGQPEPVGDALKFALPGMPPIMVQTKGSWTYVALNPQRLETTPPDPAALLGALPRLYDVALRVKIQAVPAALRNQLLDAATESLPLLIPSGQSSQGSDGPNGFPGDDPFSGSDDASARAVAGELYQPVALQDAGGIGGQPPFGPPAADPNLQAAIDQQIDALRRFLDETDQLVFGIVVDDAKQELRLDFIQKAVAGSSTATLFNGWKTQRPTRYAGFYRPEAGIHAHGNMKLAPETVASLTERLDAAAQTFLQSGDGGPPDGNAQQEIANTVVSALKAFVSHGDTDMVISLSTANAPSLLLAGKVSDAASMLKAISLAEVALADAPGVTIRKETVAGVDLSVWALPIPDDPAAAPVKQVLGPKLELAAGVAADNAYIAIGPPGVVTQLEAALSRSATPTVRSPYPGMMLVDAKKLVGNLNVDSIPGASEWAEQLGQVKAPSHIRLSMVPGNNAGIFRVQIGAGAVSAFAPRAVGPSDEDSPFGDGSGAFDDADDVFGAPR